ncbi:MAG: antibiotic biosynthesis monooxygenase [Jiangellales bacterium]
MLSVTRHRVPAPRAEQFRADAEAAMDLLRQRPGFVAGVVGRATDDAELWLVSTSWADVGSFRRALSSYEVKIGAVPLLASAIDEATAFERLLVADERGVHRRGSDRAADADTSGPPGYP